MDENVDVWGALGLEAPADEQAPEGGQAQEIADPADTGEQVQEIADPADIDDGAEEEKQPEAAPDKKPLTKEERAANAASRRQKEINDAVQAALDKERKETEAKLKKFFDQAQLKHGDTVIDSLEKAEQWVEKDRAEKLKRNLQSGKLTPEDLQAALEQSPAFKAMQEKQAASERAEAEQSKQKFDMDVELQLAEIQKLNPEIKSLADIIKMPTRDKFVQLVQQYNMNYLDAYKLANHEAIVEQARNVAATGARVAASGKEHINKTTTRGEGKIDVPKDEKDRYRMLDPSMTDADIEKHYRKWMVG